MSDLETTLNDMSALETTVNNKSDLNFHLPYLKATKLIVHKIRKWGIIQLFTVYYQHR